MFYLTINIIFRCSFVWFCFTVVIERAVSDERKSLIFRYCINAVIADNLGFWGNAPKLIGFNLLNGRECFNSSSNTNVHSESVRYILVIFKCTMVLTRIPDNNINRHSIFLGIFISVSVGMFHKKIRRALMFRMGLFFT